MIYRFIRRGYTSYSPIRYCCELAIILGDLKRFLQLGLKLRYSSSIIILLHLVVAVRAYSSIIELVFLPHVLLLACWLAVAGPSHSVVFPLFRRCSIVIVILYLYIVILGLCFRYISALTVVVVGLDRRCSCGDHLQYIGGRE